MANPDIGRCNCPLCGQPAAVRQYGENTKAARRGRRKLYLSCDDCGQLTPNLSGGQNWILENAELFSEGRPQEPAEPEKQPAPASPPPKKGLLGLLDFDL